MYFEIHKTLCVLQSCFFSNTTYQSAAIQCSFQSPLFGYYQKNRGCAFSYLPCVISLFVVNFENFSFCVILQNRFSGRLLVGLWLYSANSRASFLGMCPDWRNRNIPFDFLDAILTSKWFFCIPFKPDVLEDYWLGSCDPVLYQEPAILRIIEEEAAISRFLCFLTRPRMKCMDLFFEIGSYFLWVCFENCSFKVYWLDCGQANQGSSQIS